MQPSLRHPLLPGLRPSPTPEACASQLAGVLPLQRLLSLAPPSEWWHLEGHLPHAPLPVAASLGSPMLLEANRADHHWLILVHDGQAIVSQQTVEVPLGAGDGVILRGLPWTLITQPSSTTILGFEAKQVMGAALAIAPPGWEPPPPLSSPLGAMLPLLGRNDSSCGALMNTTSLLLPVIQQVAGLGEVFLDRFLGHQLLYRLIAGLVFAELRDSCPAAPLQPTGRDERLDPVLDYIQTHLSEPLPMDLLEAKSNYSRRTLHYAFKQRFGCSPLEWIRQQRMALALQRLQQSQPGDTLQTIASACGYNTLNRFNIDFQRTYNCRPAAVLRKLRQHPA